MIIKGVTVSPIAIKLIVIALLYALGYVGGHILHLPQDEVESIDHEAEKVLIETVETAL